METQQTVQRPRSPKSGEAQAAELWATTAPEPEVLTSVDAQGLRHVARNIVGVVIEHLREVIPTYVPQDVGTVLVAARRYAVAEIEVHATRAIATGEVERGPFDVSVRALLAARGIETVEMDGAVLVSTVATPIDIDEPRVPITPPPDVTPSVHAGAA